MKYIKFQFNADKSIWLIPVKSVAANKAAYYHSQLDISEQTEDAWMSFYSEFENDSDSDLIDWLMDNMNWSDIKRVAIQQQSINIDYNLEWSNYDFEVTEIFSL